MKNNMGNKLPFHSIIPAGSLIRSVSLLIALLLGSGALAVQAVDIIDLHHNNSSGIPASPYQVGAIVTISGTVTVGVGTFTNEYTDVYLQDSTAGVMIYDIAIPHNFALGDSVTFTGEIKQYQGMTEVDLDTYTIEATGVECPEPLVLTCSDVENAFLPDYSEPNEGRLIRLNNVTWTGAWPTFSGGVTLHDDSGSCTLFIDGTTGLQEMTPPSGAFNVIGVIKQWAGYSPPYTSGYEVLPRFETDFVLNPGPQFIDGPRETDIVHNSVTIHVETDTDTDALVNFGETDSYELGTVVGGTNGPLHDLAISGLDPATIYHYQVVVEDTEGTTTSPDLLFCSGSGVGCTGTITSIFNKSVDHDLAGGYGEARGNQDLSGWLIDRINATNHSLDIALYSFNLSSVADAIIAAKTRGVVVRFVYDNRPTYQAEVTRLMNAGIFVIDDSYGANSGSEIMHHKLWIFDAASPDPADAWVYTGSWNLSSQGTYTDAQNMIMIQDQALAKVCTFEFEEMWGSTFWLPNPDNSRFGTNKSDNTPKIFNIGGREASMYFAPSDPWMVAVANEVERADYSIYFSILSFTRYDLTNEMEDRWMNIPGMAVRGVFDSGESGSDYTQYLPMHGEGEYAWDPPADVWFDTETGSLHHKYMILDVNHEDSDPVLITGSANWSNNAVNENDENVFIVHDATIANHYLQEFANRYHAAGGTGIFTSSVDTELVSKLSFRAGPNPSRAAMQISFSLPEAGHTSCEIYSVDGRCIDHLLDDTIAAGEHTINWSPQAGSVNNSGIYYIRLTTPAGTLEKPITLIR